MGHRFAADRSAKIALTLARVTILVAFAPSLASAVDDTPKSKTIARCGKGWLEKINGYPVLHLKGTPYEIGYQHGALLRESVRQNMTNLIRKKGATPLVHIGPFAVTPRHIIEVIVRLQNKFVPQRYFDELRGLADGAGLKYSDVRAANFIPEMFHCSGFALMNSATRNGKLLHGRVLDYAIDWGLQSHAVIIVVEPENGIPFVNVSYAGFTGSVTGMNKEGISIGEMGGRGLGHWRGVPMAILVRMALEKSKSLEQAIAVFKNNPRTCQYFYVIADGKAKKAVGMEASWDRFLTVSPGERIPLLPTPVKDCVLLSAGGRYKELVKRTKSGHGKFTPEAAMALMKRPVAMKSNLHNVLFEPESTRFWVANATAKGDPACNQKYHAFQLTELLKRTPSRGVRSIPMPNRQAKRDARRNANR